jgi:LPS sulfotransferase NodH
MSTFFVLIASARTGGTYLTTLLDSHSNIRMVGEPFIEKALSSHAEQLEWIDQLVEKQNQHGISVGLRTKVKHIADHDLFCEKMTAIDSKFIFLERENLVKRAISRIRSMRLRQVTGFNNVRVNAQSQLPPDEAISVEKLTFHIKICEEELREVSAFKNKVKEHSPPILSLTYEDIVAQPEAVTAEVLNFLGNKPEQLQARVKKYTNDDLRKSVPNYDELFHVFKGTVYEEMF